MKNGFSLVELSIVLVILGLLTGGILAGQSLIRASELRSVTMEYNRYYTAEQAFRDKYFAIPGDMSNATSFWGIAGGTGSDSTCSDVVSTGAATCNGNADGLVITSTGSREHFRFWQHLANAGLIEGQFTGMYVGASGIGTSTANAPKSKLGVGLWFVYDYGTLSGNGTLFDGVYRNVFEMGAPTTGPAQPANPLVKPDEIWNIDTKMDDGKPATGKLVVRAISGIEYCTDTASPSTLTASYLLSASTVSCNFIFRNLF